MNKLRVEEVIVVEGKYDVARLSGIVDALILQTGGFSVFSQQELRELIVSLGQKRGLIVLTDSDAAGFRIRNYINKIAQNVSVKNAYIPAIAGKEKRKEHHSKEGLLGVEGISDDVILQALLLAGAQSFAKKEGRQITYTDLYELGISGTQGSAALRRTLLKDIGLPPRLSKKALCEVLNSLFTYEELAAKLQ